jgi:hypothetical protein
MWIYPIMIETMGLYNQVFSKAAHNSIVLLVPVQYEQQNILVQFPIFNYGFMYIE